MNDILFRSEDIEVRGCPGAETGRAVVTFDSYHDEVGLDRAGFGESYFAHHGIRAIHVVTRGNDWFQYEEMAQVCAIINDALFDADRILAYGSSMGGYGAIRFADAIGAHTVLALSPQYSVDPRRVRFERRWMQDQRRIRFRREIDGRVSSRARVVVAYDPALRNDRRHVDLIAKDVAIERLTLPDAGHPAAVFLSEVDLLKPLVEAALDGIPDVGWFIREGEARRERSASWLSQRSALAPAGREAVALAERAVSLVPDSPSTHDCLAQRLAEAGRFEQAIAEHRQAIALDRTLGQHAYRWNLAKTLHRSDDNQTALTVIQDLQRLAPSVASHHRQAARLKFALGDSQGAMEDLATAIRLAPANGGYRWSARFMRLRQMIRLQRTT